MEPNCSIHFSADERAWGARVAAFVWAVSAASLMTLCIWSLV